MDAIQVLRIILLVYNASSMLFVGYGWTLPGSQP